MKEISEITIEKRTFFFWLHVWNLPFSLSFPLLNREKNEVFYIHFHGCLWRTKTYPVITTNAVGTASVTVLVVVVVVGIRWRVVVHASSLRAMRVKPCNDSHSNIQYLHVLPHISASLCIYDSVLFFKTSFFLPFPFLNLSSVSRKTEVSKKQRENEKGKGKQRGRRKKC